MPRLGIGFDTDQFLNHCRMTKPPYDCPHVSCGKTYRSFAGIQHHMNTFDHENPSLNSATPKSSSALDPDLIPIPMSTDLKVVEFELDGHLTTISVYDPLEIMSKEHYEASLPPVVDDPPITEQAKIPTAKLNSAKHGTPKTPKNRPLVKDKGVDVQRYTIEEKKTHKLPEAVFKIIPDYYKNIPDAPKQTDQYFNFIEKSQLELDEEVEYDMDEEDRSWLEMINEQREIEELGSVSMEDFELLMDRLEKESFFQAQSSGRETGVPIDEDAVCCICMDGECQNSNVILFCDMCNLAVHQECYGVPYIPEGQWLCRRCLQSPSRAVDCALCPNKGGAFKQTDDNRWAHVVCAMWIPEVCFANTVFLEPIDSIGNIPPARWKLTCYICVQRGVGACIQCNKFNCYTAFHVTCAQQAGLHMKIDAVRETSAVGTSVTVRKAAYCDMHTPADSDARPQVEEVMDAAKKASAKAASRQKMKKARKILAEKRSAAPIVSVPILPAERIQHLASLVNIEKRSLFIRRLLAYWTLKRQSRNGVPLLRRLTSSYSRRNANASSCSVKGRSPTPTSPVSPRMKKRTVPKKEKSVKKDEEKPIKKDPNEKLREEIKHWQQLRQDLERARLLCELIRKREKTKREFIKAKADERFVQLSPFVHLLLQKIDLLQEKDQQQIFAEPVDFEEVPDYLDVVKHPMDLSTMRQKAQAHQYQNIQQFAADFDLMVDNCLTYNSRDTVFYRAGVRLRDVGGAIIRQLKRDVENIGFDPETGLLLSSRPKPPPELSDQQIIKEVDDLFEEEEVCDMESLEERMRKLFDLLDKASSLKHPVSRMKKVKLIRREIGITRRRLAICESGSVSHGRSSVTHRSDSDAPSEKDDTDMDDSSVIDDEAEPGVPSRPNSPVTSTLSLPQLTPKINEASASAPISTPLKTSSASVKSKDKRSSATPRTPAASSASSSRTPVTSSLKKKKITKMDVKQRRIDMFFNKVEGSNEGSRKGKKKEQGSSKTSDKSDPMDETVDSPPCRKRGRPCYESSMNSTVEATLTGVDSKSDEESKKEESCEEKTGTEEETEGKEVGEKQEKEEIVFVEPEEEPTVSGSTCLSTSEKEPVDVNSKTNEKESIESEPEIERKVMPVMPEKTASKNSPPLPEVNEVIPLVEIFEDTPLTKESFKNYRQGREMSPVSEDETQTSESNSSLSDFDDDESGSDSDSNNGGSNESDSSDGTSSGVAGPSGDQMPLEPLDLVWAKCRGYPWYPALIINPKMPRTGYFHNKVPIPVPPEEVLAHAVNYVTPMYLILFFDQKRTWQWLPRNKLEPLGENSALDKSKLVESRKPTERKAVKKAYEKAILHRCRVTGDNTGLSGDSDAEDAIPS